MMNQDRRTAIVCKVSSDFAFVEHADFFSPPPSALLLAMTWKMAVGPVLDCLLHYLQSSTNHGDALDVRDAGNGLSTAKHSGRMTYSDLT